jgi:hypothetical protein
MIRASPRSCRILLAAVVGDRAPQRRARMVSIRTNGQELVQVFADEIEAGQVLEGIARIEQWRRCLDV